MSGILSVLNIDFSKFFTGVEILEFFKNFLIQILASVVVLFLGIVSIKIASKIIVKVFTNSKNPMSERKQKTLIAILSSILKYSIYSLVVFQILSIFKMSPTSIFAIAGVGSLAIGFAAQSLVKDIIIGIFIIIEDQFAVGDFISVGSISGLVENIGLRTTAIRTIEGHLNIIPNSEIKIVTNMSKDFSRAIIDVTLPYSIEIDKILDILKDEMSLQKELIKQITKEPEVLGITKTVLNFMEIRIIADCEVGQGRIVEMEIRKCIKVRFEKEGVL